ncbi:hypothetical protein [Methanosarcina barkeri]|uniref:hypothetical protein n=1 Tax=Methanosarcina barkeri TaxID=2208 RepID=UPI00064FB2A1|nr:hypothetical protein [Methanosarcina barkeri]
MELQEELIPKPILFPNLLYYFLLGIKRVFKIQGFGIGSSAKLLNIIIRREKEILKKKKKNYENR